MPTGIYDHHKTKTPLYTKESNEKISLARKGMKLSEEHINNLSKSHMGYEVSEETRKKISQLNKGRKKPDYFGKKISKARIGMKFSDKHKENISKAAKGRVGWNKGAGQVNCLNCNFVFNRNSIGNKYCSKKCSSQVLRGENHPMWKGGITTQNKLERVRFQQTVQKQVLERDNYTCQICGERGGKLQVDHIQSWLEYVELRFSMDNCRTLCMDCHYLITFGKPKPKEIKTWGHNFKYRKEQTWI